jgi:hypothetical protein
MQKADEYRQHAQECRALARNAQNEEHRSHLTKMAETWEGLAVERERMVREQMSLAEALGPLPVTDKTIQLPNADPRL